jgi:hypothetical protein
VIIPKISEAVALRRTAEFVDARYIGISLK